MNSMRSKIVMTMFVLMVALTVPGQKTPKNSGTEKEPGIDWRLSLQDALDEAKQTNKVVMVDFWATWCAPCRAMDRRTYTDSIVITQSKKFVMVKVDIEKALADALRYQVETPPKVVFLKADGSVITSFVGFRDAAGMVKSMKLALGKVNKDNKIRVFNRKIQDSALMSKF